MSFITKEIDEFGEKTYISECFINNIQVGRFEISGPGFDTGETMSMGISIEEQVQGLGLSKILINNVCHLVRTNYPFIRPDQLLFIDTDASDGFWEYIGMKPNRYYADYGSRRDIEGVGYEMGFTFMELCKFANITQQTINRFYTLLNSRFNLTGGKSKKKIKKTRAKRIRKKKTNKKSRRKK